MKVWFSASGLKWGDWAQIAQADPFMNGLWLDLLIDALMNSTADGVPVATWHSAAFDLACLVHYSRRHGDMRRVALASIDLHLLFMAVSRHRLGLKTAATAVGSHKGGEEIADGEEASKLWPDAWEAVCVRSRRPWATSRWRSCRSVWRLTPNPPRQRPASRTLKRRGRGGPRRCPWGGCRQAPQPRLDERVSKTMTKFRAACAALFFALVALIVGVQIASTWTSHHTDMVIGAGAAIGGLCVLALVVVPIALALSRWLARDWRETPSVEPAFDYRALIEQARYQQVMA